MINPHLKKSFVVFCIILMSMTSVISVSANTQTSTTTKVSTPLQKVNINSKSYFEITDVNMIPTNGGNLVTYIVDLYNGNIGDISLVDYWSRVRTKGGTKYTANLISSDQSKEVVSPNSKVTYTFYSKVGSSTELKDILIDFIEWDFSKVNYEKLLGSVSIPSDYSFTVPFQDTKTLQVNGVPISTKVLGMSYMETSEKNIEINMQYTNEGRSGVTIPEYQYFIRTEEGLMYPLSTEEANIRLQPMVSGEIELSTSVPKQVLQENWQLVVTSLENKNGGMNIPVGFFDLKLVEIEEIVIPVNGDYVIEEPEYQISTKISKVLYVGNEVTIYYEIKNNTSKQITVPGFEYSLQSSGNQTYPIQAGTDSFSLNPNSSKEIKLSINLPVSVDKNQLKLKVMDNNKQKDNRFIYDVPQENNEASTGEIRYSNSNGLYGIKVESIQRLPYDDQDIISANVVISNKSSNALPILDVSGSFILDGVRFDDTVIDKVLNDKVLNLQPYSELNVTFYVTVPYTYQFNQFQLILQEKLADDSFKNITQFNNSSSDFSMKKINKTDYLKIRQIGKRATLRILDVNTFEGENTDIFYVLTEMKNDERRYTNLKNLAAYFKTKDDIYFPTEITNISEKVMPNGKVLIGIWSELPNGFEYGNLEFILGEQLPDAGDGAAYNAVTFELPTESQLTVSVEKVKLTPYTLSMSEVKGTKISRGAVESFDIHITFDYSLTRDYYEAYSEDLQLEYEIVAGGEVIDSRNFKLGQDLKVSKDSSMEMIIDQLDEATKKKLETINDFTLNIYRQFDENHKKQIVSKEFDWIWIQE